MLSMWAEIVKAQIILGINIKQSGRYNTLLKPVLILELRIEGREGEV